MTGKQYLCKKTHGSVAVFRLMFLYLFASLASKDGKTNFGDILTIKIYSRLAAYLHFFACSPFEP